ncbi:WD40 repeat domain-containing protein [Streptomyces sp. WSLK1-5]|uniref:WD40 repeat domain-containing protein n=1 Tax=unclassified Streptomyces TaxID=2593676 RepID=UPI000F64BA2B|nr:WD40 repeat domain-containing protein [Streptomyces sp. RP5T]RRR85124.1 WD40 repeat domain-containing protein [Streptomyces sp. RP5T]
MNVDDIVRDALREQAAEQPPATTGFADRVLAVRRRRRTRRITAAAVTVAAVLAVGVAVPLLDSGKKDVRPAGGGIVVEKKIRAHPDQSPPRDEISVGGTTMVGYSVSDTVEESADSAVVQRTYHLLDPKSGKYTKAAEWSWVAVAPGGKTAAVLERNLPASRIGLLDLTTGKVERWIQVDHGVGGLVFSRDGRKLVATTYSQNPDRLVKVEGDPEWSQPRESSRTGYFVLDVASGDGAWTEIKLGKDSVNPVGRSMVNGRQDFSLTDDGRYVWEGRPMEPGYVFYDLSGKKVPVPAGYRYLSWFVEAGRSPDGTLMAGDFAGEKWKTSSYVLDAETGAHTEERGQQLLAWVGNKQLIAWDIGKNDKNEYHNRLVLVTLGSDKEVPLSGFRAGNDGDAARWEPLFAQP